MRQMNPKKCLHNTTFSVQLPHIAGHFLEHLLFTDFLWIFTQNQTVNFRVCDLDRSTVWCSARVITVT